MIEYFRISPARAKVILAEVQAAVSQWTAKAKAIGISRSEQEQMASAFQYE